MQKLGMGTRENHDIPKLNPGVAMAWSWDASLELHDIISLYWEDNQPAPDITDSTAQRLMVSLELSVKSQQHIHTHLQACMHFLPTAIFKTDSSNAENN